MPRLVYVVTHPITARMLLRGQLGHFGRRGYDVILVCAPGPELEGLAELEGVGVRTVEMSRDMAPASDLVALVRLVRLLRELRPEIVNAGTPKAGLLGMLAAAWVRVPVRVYSVRGLRMETARGWRAGVLRASERLAAAAAHRVVCVSESLLRRYLELGLAPAEKLRVLGSGSSNGVEVERFERAAADMDALRRARRELGLPAGAPVLGFVGRLTGDKGVRELFEAFSTVRARRPEARLLILGDFEPSDPVPADLVRALTEDPGVVLTGWIPDTAPLYPLMDVLVFPSWREGFPNAPLEAAAAGVPTVGFRVTGTVDAVVDGRTGTVVPPGDAPALAAAAERYLEDPHLRRAHGEAARARAEERFRPERVWSALEGEYAALRAVRTADRNRWYRRHGKRLLDLAVAIPAISLLAPWFLLIAATVRVSMGSPVLFRQRRPGLGGRPFTLIKFRTMRAALGPEGRPLPDVERLTRFGRFLRRSSLDELPELLNVLRGEMSLVGPRPLLMKYLDLYTLEQARRHEVRPGITGWAQVRGRNAVSWEEKFGCDLWYVDHLGPGVDLRILALTVAKVLRGEGVAAGGHSTMPDFRGTPPKAG